MKLLVLNGPNLNLLGAREPEKYGSDSLAALQKSLTSRFPDVELTFFQSNHEGELIDQLHAATSNGTGGIIFNPGGYTHTSVAIRDAIAAIDVPVVEVHITNIASRESFRHVSVTSGPTVGQISGFGLEGYALAVRFFIDEMADAR
jgi:3-dehydroquinate dehydratase-2